MVRFGEKTGETLSFYLDRIKGQLKEQRAAESRRSIKRSFYGTPLIFVPI